MKKTLEFTKQPNGKYVTTMDGGKGIVQIDRKSAGLLVVSAFVEGMAPIPQVAKTFGTNVVFEIEFPTTLKVTITSASEVTDAVFIANE